ncbi:MAG: amino acid adenylation domain-containing protein [Chloroflexota bacterium]
MNDLSDQIANLPPEKLTLLLKKLAEKNKKDTARLPKPLPRVEGQTFPLSLAQTRLWLANQLEPGNSAYNMSSALKLQGSLNVRALEQSLSEVVRRHESLRTVFPTIEGQPAQMVTPAQGFSLPVLDFSCLSDDERKTQVKIKSSEQAQHAFDLACGPLFLAHLLRLSAHEHILLITIHHMVADGWSIGIFNRELAVLYPAFCAGQASPLSDLHFQYADYTVWQRQCLTEDVINTQLTYWKKQLANLPPEIELPIDRPRPGNPSFRGAFCSLRLPDRLSESLKTLGRAEGATLYMTLLAAFQTLLYGYTGQEDIPVGSSIANRDGPEIEALIGFFVNTLVLRGDLSGNPSFRELLKRTRDVALDGFANQDVPFEQLVEALSPARTHRHHPLFRVFFVLQNMPTGRLELSHLSIEELAVTETPAMFDLTLSCNETEQGINVSLGYSRDLFDTVTIENMLERFNLLLEKIARSPDCPIAELELGLALDFPSVAHRPVPDGKLPLSYHQERIWFIDQFETGNVYPTRPTYHNVPLLLHIQGPVDQMNLEISLNHLISRHTVLRTCLLTEYAQGYQQISSEANLKLKVVDLSVQSPQVSLSEAIDLALYDARFPFGTDALLLLRATLFKFTAAEAMLVVTIHHSITDKPSLWLMAEELAERYTSLVEKRPSRLADVTYQYSDFTFWQRNFPNKLKESLSFYWRRQLRGRLPVLELPTSRPRPGVHTFKEARYTFSLDRDLAEKMHAISRSEHTSQEAILLTAFKVLLRRYTFQDEIVVGTVGSGRNYPETQRMIGPVANLLVLRSSLPGQRSFRDCLNTENKVIADAYKYQAMPFDQLVQQINPEKDMSRTALFDVLFEFSEQPLPVLKLGSASAHLMDTNVGYGKYDLHLAIQAGEADWPAALVYNADIYDASLAEQMMKHYRAVLTAVAADLDLCVDAIPLLSAEEEHQQLVDWNATLADYPKDKTLHQLWSEQVIKTPDAPAVTLENSHLTYLELDQRANQLAHLLQARGVAPDMLVAVCLNRSFEMIVTLLGILKAGGAYLPMDPNYPEERLQFMLHDAQVTHLVTTHSSPQSLHSSTPSVIWMDTDAKEIAEMPCTPPTSHTSPGNLAYCIYTSGSTGKPKGVLLEHRNVVRLMANTMFPYDFDHHDVWTMFHSYCFDFSVWEMYGALLYGGRLVIVPETVAKDPVAFLDLLINEKVTVLNQTPTAFYVLAREALQTTLPKLTLRYIIFGGEALHPLTLKEWRNAYPATKLVNMYGITETTVHVTIKEITDQEIASNLSNIGVPIPTATTYLLDHDLHLLPVGVPGEVCVGGLGVGRGYLGRDELTQQKFIRNPYRAGERLYRSGDVAKYLPTGEMVYLGRSDDQVQVRGFRVELGEINSQLLKHPSISEAIVIGKESPSDSTEIVAYVVPKEDVTVTTLRSHLAQTLPSYMIPSAFVLLKSLPLTATGKVDKRALPAPESSRPDVEQAYIAPRTSMETLLAEIFTDVLHVDRVGVFDDFFELGGHSLLATQVVSRIRTTFQVELALRNMFESPTVAGLAEVIVSLGTHKASAPASPIQPIPRRTYKISEEDLLQ